MTNALNVILRRHDEESHHKTTPFNYFNTKLQTHQKLFKFVSLKPEKLKLYLPEIYITDADENTNLYHTCTGIHSDQL